MNKKPEGSTSKIILNYKEVSSIATLEVIGKFSEVSPYLFKLKRKIKIRGEVFILEYISHDELKFIISILPKGSFLLNKAGLDFLFGKDVESITESAYIKIEPKLKKVFYELFRKQKCVVESDSKAKFCRMMAKLIDSTEESFGITFIGQKEDENTIKEIILKYSEKPQETLSRVTFVDIESRILKIPANKIMICSDLVRALSKKSLLNKMSKNKYEYAFGLVLNQETSQIEERRYIYKALGIISRVSEYQNVIDSIAKESIFKI